MGALMGKRQMQQKGVEGIHLLLLGPCSGRERVFSFFSLFYSLEVKKKKVQFENKTSICREDRTVAAQSNVHVVVGGGAIRWHGSAANLSKFVSNRAAWIMNDKTAAMMVINTPVMFIHQ